jgi:hypothetical protein
MPAGVKFGGYPSKQAQDEAIASGGPSRIDGKTMKTDTFDPNLRDEGAGFFSTLFTAGSNIGTDALTELGYLAQAVASPIDTGEAILRVAAGYAQKALPDSFEQYLPEDWATNKMYANAINDYYAEKYGSLEQAADSFAEQPVSVALDVFAVKALLTAVTKQAVKRSNATTKMAKTAEGTVLEGELAARAAADLKVAAELEKTVKYEGKLKYDESLGAYVPEAELASRTSLDAAEVAPIASAIDEAVPTLNNAPLSTEGMMAATRNKEVNPALVDNYETWLNNPFMDEGLAINERGLSSIPPKLADGSLDNARVIEGMNIADEVAPITAEAMGTNVVSREQMIALAEAKAAAKRKVGELDDAEYNIYTNEGQAAADVFYNSDVVPVKIAAIDAEIAHLEAIIANAGSQGKASSGSQRVLRDENIKKVALEQDITKLQATDVYNSMLDDVALAEQAALFPLIDEVQKAAIIKNGGNSAEVIGIVESNQKAAIAMQEALAARNAGAVPDVPVTPVATSGIDLKGTRTGDGSLKVATQADEATLLRNETRMADDAKMAAASQAELFSPDVPAAAYEIAQASKIANDLAKVSPDVPAVVGTRMLATSPETKLAKYADVERRTTPPSIPQTKLKVDAKKVVPAIQRVAAASGQAERGPDNSFLPAPDLTLRDQQEGSGELRIEPFVPIVPERIDVEQPENTRPGWKLPHQFEGSTREGNYWSADFEDEHWNTPAGINEAMGIWGRPIGNRKIVNPR